MPFVANPREPPTDLVGELLAELARPLPHGFVTDDDATRGQQLLHHAQPEREAEIKTHGVADDLGRKPMPGVAGASGCRHPARLLTPAYRCKRSEARQVGGTTSTRGQKARIAPTQRRRRKARIS